MIQPFGQDSAVRRILSAYFALTTVSGQPSPDTKRYHGARVKFQIELSRKISNHHTIPFDSIPNNRFTSQFAMALAEEDEWSFEDEDEDESNEFSDGDNHHAGIPWDFDEGESDEDDENDEDDDDENDDENDDESDDESDEEEEDDGGQLVSGGRFGSHHGIAESMRLPVEILGKPVVIADKSGEEFCVFDHEICSAEITLRNLVNCTVNLCGVSSAVLIEDLQNCVVFVGPCSGCVIISRCNACSINVVCKKLEVEKSTNCTLYVKTISQTFIKASSAITFAPLKRGYEEMQDHVEVIGLEGTLNCWDCVVDVR